MDPILKCGHFIFFDIPYKDIRVQRERYIPGISCLTQPTQSIRHSKFYTLQLYLKSVCNDTKTFALTNNNLHELHEIGVVQNNKNA